MKIFKLIFLSYLSILSIILISCSSDNPTGNNQQGNFSFLNVGYWWLYERYPIDTLGNKDGNSYNDSTFITGRDTVLGKYAYNMKTVTPGSEDIENYCYTEGEMFFIHSDFVNNIIDSMLKQSPVKLPISLGKMWVKIADYNNNNWLIKTDTIPTTEITTGITINGTFTVSGEKGTSKNMTINSKTFIAQEFKLIFKFEGFISLAPTVKKTFSITIHSWFDKNTGILLQTFDNSNFELAPGFSFPFKGYEKMLLRYNVTSPLD